MFGIGMPEMILILAIALVVLGPKKLPDLAKSLGRAMREFKKATSEFKESIDVDTDLKDVKKTFDDMDTEIRETIDVTSPLSTESESAYFKDIEQDEDEPQKEAQADTSAESGHDAKETVATPALEAESKPDQDEETQT